MRLAHRRHVEEHLAPAREHLLERVRGEVEREARVDYHQRTLDVGAERLQSGEGRQQDLTLMGVLWEGWHISCKSTRETQQYNVVQARGEGWGGRSGRTAWREERA